MQLMLWYAIMYNMDVLQGKKKKIYTVEFIVFML